MRQDPQRFPNALLYVPFRLSRFSTPLWVLQDGPDLLLDLRSITDAINCKWRTFTAEFAVHGGGRELTSIGRSGRRVSLRVAIEPCIDRTGRPTWLVDVDLLMLTIDFMVAHARGSITADQQLTLRQLRRVWRHEWSDVCETDLAHVIELRDAARAEMRSRHKD
ncbi:MAG: hypothetical protein J0M20_01430 [Burkholderiales bacterium]|nr:hypothetical protein [Burkholderiales bacterium]